MKKTISIACLLSVSSIAFASAPQASAHGDAAAKPAAATVAAVVAAAAQSTGASASASATASRALIVNTDPNCAHAPECTTPTGFYSIQCDTNGTNPLHKHYLPNSDND